MQSHLSSLKDKKIELISSSEKETVSIGEGLSRLLKPGDIVALVGDLGSGKTYFTKGIAMGFGISPDIVTSPSFTLVNEYEGKIKLFHIDAYRLEKEDFLLTGLDEYFYEDGITVMEWADKWPELLPEDTIWVEFEILDENKRKITIRGLRDDNNRKAF